MPLLALDELNWSSSYFLSSLSETFSLGFLIDSLTEFLFLSLEMISSASFFSFTVPPSLFECLGTYSFMLKLLFPLRNELTECRLLWLLDLGLSVFSTCLAFLKTLCFKEQDLWRLCDFGLDWPKDDWMFKEL